MNTKSDGVSDTPSEGAVRKTTQEVICGDSLEVLRGFSSGSFDLILCDPPYGMSYQSAWRTATPQFAKIESDDDISWFPDFAREIYRVLKDDRHAYIFCNDYSISDFRKELEKAGFVNKRTLVWVKNNHTSGDLEGDYGNKTEFILFAHKGRRVLNGRRETNVLNFARVSDLLHPTQKPVDINAFLIEKSTNEGESVLDPYCGSGSTLIAAKNLKRNSLGIEISPEYCEIARQRLHQSTLL